MFFGFAKKFLKTTLRVLSQIDFLFALMWKKFHKQTCFGVKIEKSKYNQKQIFPVLFIWCWLIVNGKEG